jgi:GT2 family glycosyltransferase
MTSKKLPVAVVVPTYNRPEHVRTCLMHIAAQTIRPVHTVVVDSSRSDATYQVVATEFPGVEYLRNPLGVGHLAASRDLGLRAVTADVVVFFDDDAYAEASCIEQLSRPYNDPAVGGVGGLVRNGIPDEESAGADQIGLFLSDGTLTGNFAANPGRPVIVDHLLGACMSWRREILLSNGGIHDDYPGSCLREDTDIAFRAAKAGWQIVYQPSAVVRHVSAPYHKGHRFDLRYTYYADRNHLVLLMQNLGPGDPRIRRYFGVAARGVRSRVISAIHPAARNDRQRPLGRRLAGALAHSAATASGLAVGTAIGYAKWRSRPLIH